MNIKIGESSKSETFFCCAIKCINLHIPIHHLSARRSAPPSSSNVSITRADSLGFSDPHISASS